MIIHRKRQAMNSKLSDYTLKGLVTLFSIVSTFSHLQEAFKKGTRPHIYKKRHYLNGNESRQTKMKTKEAGIFT